jgi:hypothetical protein
MAKKSTKIQQPNRLLVVLAVVIVASMVAYSGYILNEALQTYINIPHAPLIVALVLAKVSSALLPIIVGVIVYMTAQGGKLRRFVVSAVYIGIYWVAKTVFAVFAPTYPIMSNLIGEETYRNSGVNFFLEYLFGALVALIVYFATRKRTMKLNHLTVGFAMFAAVFLLIEALGYFLR